ncbi:formate dehydrogenase accessory sulfurtransferase FdhD [Niallia oryzisoli]|uniref:formate dehydrogenase accessory sulfurtransferase FdhD n=1 Tax=Niallia oryzisoli TaxID=1737571 RepID=UPI0037363221
MKRKSCPEEYPITLKVNGYEVAVFQLTNQDLTDWTYGYMFSEGLITKKEEIQSVHFDPECGEIQSIINNEIDIQRTFSQKKYYTAGCGRGITFFSMTDVKQFNKVENQKTYRLSYLLEKRSEFAKNSPLYLETGGMHGACIVKESGDIVIREDIGRHNAVDKVIGHAVRQGLNPNSLLLLTTGRISYEMLSKAAKFGFSVIGSRTAATKQAIQLAKYLNIEMVGYLRGKMAVNYTGKGRIINDIGDSEFEIQRL